MSTEIKLEECHNFDPIYFKHLFSAWDKKEGHWYVGPVTGEPGSIMIANEIFDFKNMKVYWYRIGRNNYISWIILGKCGKYWIFFEASRNYDGSGFWTEGTILWSEDFNMMYDMGLSEGARTAIDLDIL